VSDREKEKENQSRQDVGTDSEEDQPKKKKKVSDFHLIYETTYRNLPQKAVTVKEPGNVARDEKIQTL
jgi:hypothetical protein